MTSSLPSLPSLVFMGTPDFAVPALSGLIEAGYPIQAVYTQPPRPKGRGHCVQKSAVHLFAERHGLRILTPVRLKEEVETLQQLAPHLIIVAAYGLLLPAPVLKIPPHGCLNIHASLLPRWRGAAPVQYAVLEGDTTTGITLMCMDEGMDTGAMIRQATYPISHAATAGFLISELSQLGADLLLETLPDYLSGRMMPIPQPTEGVRLAPKIKPSDGCLLWTHPAQKLERQIRALDPWPGAWFTAQNKRFKVHSAEICARPQQLFEGEPGTILDEHFLIGCGEGSALRLLTLTPEGRKPMSAEACLRGYPFLKAGFMLA